MRQPPTCSASISSIMGRRLNNRPIGLRPAPALDPRRNSWIDQLYVPPAAGEAGTAVGAALFGWCEIFGAPPPCELETAFRVRPYSDAEIGAAIDEHGEAPGMAPRRLDR